jgi:N-acetylglucosamine-6-phosphate deacetylase
MKIPGLFDLQVNGYKGIDFSSPELTEESFIFCCREIINAGTTIFLPTIITSSEELYHRNLQLIDKAINKGKLSDHIPGLHIEGPFISMEDGARGAHTLEWVRLPDPVFFEKMIAWSGNRIRVLTLAPEVNGAAELTGFAVSKGILVSLGHTHASKNEMIPVIKMGASLVTHLGNGIAKILHRQENPIIAALANDDLTATIITDGFHVTPDMIKVIFKIKGVSKTIIISDQCPVAGFPPGKYFTLGNNIVLEENGYLHNPQAGVMVGSSRTMLQCVNYFLSLKHTGIEDVIKMAFHNPLSLVKSKIPESKLFYSKEENRILIKS